MAVQFDLEERTFQFARDVRAFVKGLNKSIANFEDFEQVVRSSGSVGANYVEANEALSRKDFVCRIEICRKEAKETCYWLRLLDLDDHSDRKDQRAGLLDEATQLMKILERLLLILKPRVSV